MVAAHKNESFITMAIRARKSWKQTCLYRVKEKLTVLQAHYEVWYSNAGPKGRINLAKYIWNSISTPRAASNFTHNIMELFVKLS